MAALPPDRPPPKGQSQSASTGGTGSSPAMGRLAELDRTVSLAVFRSIGVLLPRPLLMLFEHAGNGLFWLPGVHPHTTRCLPHPDRVPYATAPADPQDNAECDVCWSHGDVAVVPVSATLSVWYELAGHG